nr:hypothetical protein [uncultured Roseovarius sp.]
MLIDLLFCGKHRRRKKGCRIQAAQVPPSRAGRRHDLSIAKQAGAPGRLAKACRPEMVTGEYPHIPIPSVMVSAFEAMTWSAFLVIASKVLRDWTYSLNMVSKTNFHSLLERPTSYLAIALLSVNPLGTHCHVSGTLGQGLA